MKFAIVSKDNTQRIVDVLNMFGLDIDKNQPDFVISYGGDGTVLFSERKYPGIPKITLRRSNSGSGGSRCIYSVFELEDILLKIESGKYTIKEEIKLVAELKQRDYISAGEALNEVQIHNASPIKAIRFFVEVDDKKVFGEEIIGDGIIIATPFGSTAYYKSVGGKRFEKGIGIALNNPYNVEREPLHIDEGFNPTILIRILREEGFLLFDNDNKMIPVKKEDEIIVRKSENIAKFVVV
jgi:NAD+ kinase